MFRDDNREDFLGYIRIQTNISKSFFADDEDEDKFYDFITDNISREEYIVDDVPFDGISRLIVSVYDFEEDHSVTAQIKCDPALEPDAWDNIIANDDFVEYLEETVIPEFIDWFNSSTTIEFPTNREEYHNLFSDMRFDGEDYYTRVYQKSNGTYEGISVNSETLQLDKYDFEYEI